MENFKSWMDIVTKLAMKTEWILDRDEEAHKYWRPKFESGLSPEVALQKYWDEIT